jgi:hypothetical protein
LRGHYITRVAQAKMVGSNVYCKQIVVPGNDIEQTANTYNLNTFNKVLIKTSKAKLKQLRLALLRHILIYIFVNGAIMLHMLPKIF